MLDLVRFLSRVHMVVNLWCAPVWGWVLTASGSTWGASVPHNPSGCSMVPMYCYEELLLGGGKLRQFFFLDLFLWKVLSPERHRPVKMTGYTQ